MASQDYSNAAMEMKLNEWTEVLIIVVALRSCEIPYVQQKS